MGASALALSISFLFPVAARGADRLILSVTPPLFELNMGQGEFWASSLKVVNTNPYELTLYAATVDFAAEGEAGQSRLIPILETGASTTAASLAHWIDVPSGPVTVGRERSAEIPFSIRIPADASPGGHYAAILVGTQPPTGPGEGASIRVSSFVSSLILVTVKGQIVERGAIRDFYPERRFYQKPAVNLILRFENMGTTHIQPQGDVSIYDLWGRRVAEIPVNQESSFGNVLPGSVRRFEFSWEGNPGISTFGRYRAVATLAFGKDARETATKETSFWIIPLAPLGILGAAFGILALCAFLAIRVYVRSVIASHVRRPERKRRPKRKKSEMPAVEKNSGKNVSEGTGV